MPAYYDEIDLWFTRAGDFSIEEGDLKDTSSDGLRSLVQDIITTAKSALRDWKLQPGDGANSDEFVGRPQNARTASLIHDRLRTAIISKNLVEEQDLSITPIPVSRQEILVIFRVTAAPTPYNRLGQGEALVIEILYNYEENGTFVFEPSVATTYDV